MDKLKPVQQSEKVIHLFLSIPEGQNVRSVLENGFLDSFFDRWPSSRVTIITLPIALPNFMKDGSVEAQSILLN